MAGGQLRRPARGVGRHLAAAETEEERSALRKILEGVREAGSKVTVALLIEWAKRWTGL
jgi:hypothetical protein